MSGHHGHQSVALVFTQLSFAAPLKRKYILRLIRLSVKSPTILGHPVASELITNTNALLLINE